METVSTYQSDMSTDAAKTICADEERHAAWGSVQSHCTPWPPRQNAGVGRDSNKSCSPGLKHIVQLPARRYRRNSDISCRSIRETTALVCHFSIASRSCARSRAQGPPTAKRSFLPGANVMPISPRLAPASTASIRSGCDSLVFVILICNFSFRGTIIGAPVCELHWHRHSDGPATRVSGRSNPQ